MHEQKCVDMLLSVPIVFIFKEMCFVYIENAFCMGICVLEWSEERGLCVKNSLLFWLSLHLWGLDLLFLFFFLPPPTLLLICSSTFICGMAGKFNKT